MHASPQNVQVFEALPQTQVLARSVLALLLGSIMVIFAHSSWVTVISGVTFLLIADGALGLLLQRHFARTSGDSWASWLLPMWSFNLGLGSMVLLAVTFNQHPLVAVVLAVVTAITTGVWLMAFLHSGAQVRRALFLWAVLLFLSAAALPIVWTLGLTPLDAWSPRILGGLKVLLGLLMLVLLKRSW